MDGSDYDDRLLDLQLRLFRSAADKMDRQNPGWSERGDAPDIDGATNLTADEEEELRILLGNKEDVAA